MFILVDAKTVVHLSLPKCARDDVYEDVGADSGEEADVVPKVC